MFIKDEERKILKDVDGEIKDEIAKCKNELGLLKRAWAKIIKILVELV
jgi:hypothetical protein